MKKTFTVAKVMEKILRSLIDDFENVVCAIEESRNLEKMAIDDIENSLEAHEQRKKKKKRSLWGSLTNKDDHQGVQSDVCPTQPRKRMTTWRS